MAKKQYGAYSEYFYPLVLLDSITRWHVLGVVLCIFALGAGAAIGCVKAIDYVSTHKIEIKAK